jgi:hypothetical protein
LEGALGARKNSQFGLGKIQNKELISPPRLSTFSEAIRSVMNEWLIDD